MQQEAHKTGLDITHTQSEFGPSYSNMQNTASDRFTSLKKKAAPQNIKMNKFSSSGIGHFNVTAKHHPPTSPTPTTGQVIKDGISRAKPSLATGTAVSAVDDQTELVEQTNDQFVEFDLKLNN